jgi:UDP-GlcNAc:undecaprenyl-phosphate GlcNAc-1-phosphate transferase
LLESLQLIIFCLGGFAVSVLCNELLLRFSASLGIRNKNDVVIRWSNQSKPSLGGVSFFVVFIFTAIAYSIFYYQFNIFHNIQFLGLFLAGSMAFVMGLADDAYNTRPGAKLAIQIMCGLSLVFTGSTIHLFHNDYLDSLVTVLWVIGVMNSLNMLDNMDGITGTTVFFILSSCLISSWMIVGFNADMWSILIISVLGGMIGFLLYNVNPAKLFMGDAGSQFIGLFVAFFAIHNLWNVGSSLEQPSWLGLVITLVAFTPAAVDTLTVVINRVKSGKSPMVGGKDHTTHHLVYAGLKDRSVWVVFVILGLLSLLISITMISLAKEGILISALFFSLYFILVFVLLYRNTIKFQSPDKEGE